MSWVPAAEPHCTVADDVPAIEWVIEARPRQIEALTVGRLLPSAGRRLVGPFIFFDHMGPADLRPGQGADVRPHPHIGLATVTYLFEGTIFHRDSIGSAQAIAPGAINWMTAGRGIVHSERTPPDVRAAGSRLHGLQLWVALPREHEERDPEFHHYPAESLPLLADGAIRLRVLAGTAFGVTAPVRIFSPLFYVEALLADGALLPLPQEHEERAAYVVEGAVSCGDERFDSRRMLVFAPGSSPALRAEGEARVVLLGGATIDGPRHIWWNFVSSSPERIERAKLDWKEGRFPTIPGDDVERVPLPK